METETPITNKKIPSYFLFSMVNDKQTDDNEPQFARDLMKAGYEKQNSEGENYFLRQYDLSRDDQLSDDKNRVYKNNVTGYKRFP